VALYGSNSELYEVTTDKLQGHQEFPPEFVIKKPNQVAFQPHFPTYETNEELSLMVAGSLSDSISCFKVQSSFGHLVWIFDNGNSIVSGGNSWRYCQPHFRYQWLDVSYS